MDDNISLTGRSCASVEILLTALALQTLPPILDKSVDQSREESKESKRYEAALWRQPTPPKPFLLHLGITARTHSIANFQENFFGEFNNFFIDK